MYRLSAKEYSRALDFLEKFTDTEDETLFFGMQVVLALVGDSIGDTERWTQRWFVEYSEFPAEFTLADGEAIRFNNAEELYNFVSERRK